MSACREQKDPSLLPEDMINMIFSLFDPKELSIQTALVSRSFRMFSYSQIDQIINELYTIEPEKLYKRAEENEQMARFIIQHEPLLDRLQNEEKGVPNERFDRLLLLCMKWRIQDEKALSRLSEESKRTLSEHLRPSVYLMSPCSSGSFEF